MADRDSKKLTDVSTDIDNEEIVQPVIQRNLVCEQIPSQADSIQSAAQPAPLSQPGLIDKAALMAALPMDCQQHPVLKNATTWEDVFGKSTGWGKKWSTRYHKELAAFEIHTIGDFALMVMTLGIKFSYISKLEAGYSFANLLPNGTRIYLRSMNFGSWAWGVALGQLEKNGLNWKAFLIK